MVSDSWLPWMESLPDPPSIVTDVSIVNDAAVTALKSIELLPEPPVTFSDLTSLAATVGVMGDPFKVTLLLASTPTVMLSLLVVVIVRAPVVASKIVETLR